jgi:hypothetical protein
MRWKRVAAVAAGITVAALAANGWAAELTAAQIVDRNVAARGGLEAWRKIQTMVWVGHMESSHTQLPTMLFVMQQQRPNKTRFEVNALGQRTVRVFDGTRGWKAKPNREGGPDVKPFTFEEVTFAHAGQVIDGPLIDYAAKGNTVTLEGVDQIEGHKKAYRLGVRLATGENDHVWVDAQTFLDLRYDRPSSSAAGAPTVSVFYRDYKTTEGLQIPSVIETGLAPGVTPDRMVIERVMLNGPVDEHTFARPGTHEHRGGMAMGNQSRPPVQRAPIDPAATPGASRPDPAPGPASAPGSRPN